MKPLVLLFALAVSLISCQTKVEEPNANVLVQVAGASLYKSDLQNALPSGLSGDDSIRYADDFIRSWVEDALLYDVAEKNIPNTLEINRLVETYRHTLIVHAYQQELIKQRFSTEMPEQELRDYYENHLDLFRLERPLVRGLFLKVPLKAPQLAAVRQWYRDTTQVAVENIEKYSLKYSLAYDYFYNRWVPLDDLLGKIPLKETNPETYIQTHRHIEVTDTIAHYFLHITDFLSAGDACPYDHARPQVLELLANRKKTEYIRQVKADLYDEAIRDERILLNVSN
jgi:hypothetical protein